jgi:hypothetical protein
MPHDYHYLEHAAGATAARNFYEVIVNDDREVLLSDEGDTSSST